MAENFQMKVLGHHKFISLWALARHMYKITVFTVIVILWFSCTRSTISFQKPDDAKINNTLEYNYRVAQKVAEV